MLVPQLSRWSLHPFSVASGGAAGHTITLHIKRYGAFTGVSSGACWLAGRQSSRMSAV